MKDNLTYRTLEDINEFRKRKLTFVAGSEDGTAEQRKSYTNEFCHSPLFKTD